MNSQTLVYEYPDDEGLRNLLVLAYEELWRLLQSTGNLTPAKKEELEVKIGILRLEPSARNVLNIGMKVAQVQAMVGEHAKAVAEANNLLHEQGRSPSLLYGAAGVFSLASLASSSDQKLSKGERARLMESHARRAVELLAKARSAGHFKYPTAVARMKADTVLDPLRERDDFKQFLRALDKQQSQSSDNADPPAIPKR